MLLNTAGNTEARPTNVLQSYTSNDYETVEWLGELEDQSGGQESEIQLHLYTPEDNDTIEWLERLENSQPGLQESGIEDEASAMVGEADVQEIQTSQILSNARKARDASNACITRYEYRIYYNIGFRVAVCKQGCKRKVKIFQFSNGQTRAIVYDCYI